MPGLQNSETQKNWREKIGQLTVKSQGGGYVVKHFQEIPNISINDTLTWDQVWGPDGFMNKCASVHFAAT
jgi:hypothetical protein